MIFSTKKIASGCQEIQFPRGSSCFETFWKLCHLPRCFNLLTVQQRTWICIEFTRSNNTAEVIRRWPNDRPPTGKTVMKTLRKWFFSFCWLCHGMIIPQFLMLAFFTLFLSFFEKKNCWSFKISFYDEYTKI